MSEKPEGPLLRADDLVRTYPDGQVQALRGVSLEVARGESVAITGPSGCGKSTLLHVLGGLDRPTSGEVTFEGQALGTMDLDAFRARRLGFVFQSFHLLPTLSALENVQIPMFEAPWPRTERAGRAARLLDEVGLGHRKDHFPNRLSVGERQRVAIARALANDPLLLLADEPTGNLDPHTAAEVFAMFMRTAREKSLAALVATHNMELAKRMDRIVTLENGTLV